MIPWRVIGGRESTPLPQLGDRHPAAFRLLEQTPMKSLERNRILAEMAEMVRRDPRLAEALSSGAFPAAPSGGIATAPQQGVRRGVEALPPRLPLGRVGRQSLPVRAYID